MLFRSLVVAGQVGETTGDPYGDDKHNKGNGILHKYPYSALVVATEYCAMYCRHCFRKRLVGLPNDKTVENFQNAAKYIAEHKEISNVIISGGHRQDAAHQGHRQDAGRLKGHRSCELCPHRNPYPRGVSPALFR